jgi:hypothetical protein
MSVDHFDQFHDPTYSKKCCTGTFFASATPFRVGDRHIMGTCWWMCPGGCQSSPKEWINRKVIVCMQHYVGIPEQNIFYDVGVFTSLIIDDRSVLNSPAVQYVIHKFILERGFKQVILIM